VCAGPAAGPIRSGGFEVTASAGLEALDEADTVVVPGYEIPDAPVPDSVLRALRAVHARGGRIVSICTGAFALAAAGLLDGRPATTHWQETGRLQRLYPRISVAPNRLFIDDADILTSAGVTAGIDLCLHIIRRDHASRSLRASYPRGLRRITRHVSLGGGGLAWPDAVRGRAGGCRVRAVIVWMPMRCAGWATNGSTGDSRGCRPTPTA
jgi:transcriptional regulator GlxA family with amidase domain